MMKKYLILLFVINAISAMASTIHLGNMKISTCQILNGVKKYSSDLIDYEFYWNGSNGIVKIKSLSDSGIVNLKCSYIDTKNWECGGERDFYWDPNSDGGKKYFIKDIYKKIDGKFSYIESKFVDGSFVRTRISSNTCEPKIHIN
jgi:hypothetical protein